MTPRVVTLPGGRSGLIIEDAPDLDAPNRTIRRARRVDPLRLIKLADWEWAAAERLRDDAALSVGYRESAGEAVRVDQGGGRVADMTARQMDALRAMAQMASGQVMTREEWDVLQYVVLAWCSLSETAAELRIDRETVGRRLRRGLAGVSGYYDGRTRLQHPRPGVKTKPLDRMPQSV